MGSSMAGRLEPEWLPTTLSGNLLGNLSVQHCTAFASYCFENAPVCVLYAEELVDPACEPSRDRLSISEASIWKSP
jgi:hypothetical protein